LKDEIWEGRQTDHRHFSTQTSILGPNWSLCVYSALGHHFTNGGVNQTLGSWQLKGTMQDEIGGSIPSIGENLNRQVAKINIEKRFIPVI